MSHIDLWPEVPAVQADQIETGFVLEDASHERQRFWYRFPSEHRAALSDSCDPYVLPAFFFAMQKNSDLLVHGQVSPSLLKNLVEFQATWASWRPGCYTPVDITAELESECDPKSNRSVLASFSGGVDTSFTVWRHHAGLAGRQNLQIQAGLMLHGFDIRLNQPEVFARAAIKAQTMLESLGLKLITMATNLKKSDLHFDDAHPAILASCMMLLQGSYAAGLIASSNDYAHPNFPWGSNPITDRLLSSSSFSTVHDAAGFTRIDKIRALADWAEASSDLRVCLRGKERDENCCRCEKCIRTILEYRLLGLGLPACFEHNVTDNQILGLNFANPGRIHYYSSILAAAKANRISASWVRALKWAYFYNNLKLKLKISLER